MIETAEKADIICLIQTKNRTNNNNNNNNVNNIDNSSDSVNLYNEYESTAKKKCFNSLRINTCNHHDNTTTTTLTIPAKIIDFSLNDSFGFKSKKFNSNTINSKCIDEEVNLINFAYKFSDNVYLNSKVSKYNRFILFYSIKKKSNSRKT